MVKNFISGGITAMAAIVAGLMLSSCEYKDLGDYGYVKDRVNVQLHFDWGQVDSIPNSMRVAFYPEDKSAYTQGYTLFDVLNRDTTIQLPAGIYSVSVWNNDTEHVIVSDYNRQEKGNATTGNYSPHGNVTIPHVLDSLYHSQRVLDYPDYMVHSYLMNFAIEEKADKEQVITLTPDSMVVTVEVKLNGIKGLEYCQNIRGAVNNVAGKRYIAYPNLTENTVAVMFDAKAHAEDSLVTARFWVFGIEPSDLANLQHKMVFFFWITGNQVFIPVDVTNVFAKATKEGTYLLIETPDLNINLRDYVRQGQTGIVVDVEDWQDTEEIVVGF